METSSYDPHKCSSDFLSEMDRLRLQVELTWKKEVRLLKQVGLRDGMEILEVGSGPGYFTKKLREEFPSSRITALELLRELHEVAQSGLTPADSDRIVCVNGAIENSGLTGGFDFAVSRYVFQHLPDPAAATREILRLLKPGGHHTIIDVDDDLLLLADPPIDELSSVLVALQTVQAGRRGNRHVGRHLPRILVDAGFAGLSIDSVSVHSDETGLEPFVAMLHPGAARQLVAAGLLTDESCKRYEKSYRDFMSSDQSIAIMNVFIVSGNRPT
ncbi:MAG: methyltransferase domain-containing protein [Patescibacteria group bacterium]